MIKAAQAFSSLSKLELNFNFRPISNSANCTHSLVIGNISFLNSVPLQKAKRSVIDVGNFEGRWNWQKVLNRLLKRDCDFVYQEIPQIFDLLLNIRGVEFFACSN